MLFYQIDLQCKEGENGSEKEWFSGCLDLFSFIKDPLYEDTGLSYYSKER